VKLLFIIKSLSMLAARGHDVTIASFDAPATNDFYDFGPLIRRIRLGIGRSDQRTGARQMLLRMGALRRLALRVAPDVAIGFMHSAYVPLGPGLAGTGIPAVASEHIVYSHYHNLIIERTSLNLTARFFHTITAISEEMRRGFPDQIRSRMRVVPNPVGVSADACADVRGGAVKVLLSVGRLEPQKDQRTLIAAFARLAPKFPDWRLRILGEGVLRAELEAQIEGLGIADKVALPGATADIASEYLGAQLFAMPSAYESFGLATAEAMAHGLPAVGFADCPGTNELIVDGESGLLVEGEDREAALADGLARLTASEELRVCMGAAAPARVAPFAPARVVDRWETLLEAAAQRRPAPF
jgi:glycosyltransferase involved in cell wall biosynthesis